MLAIQTKAPDFTLPSTSGNSFTLYKNMRMKPCILYFYPKDFTRGCTNQACGFRDTFDVFRDMNITIIGISRDDIPTHLRFKEELQLPFELLSDVDGIVGRLYDAVPPLMPFFTKRVTYLLDRQQKIAAAYENIFSAGKHIQQMVQKIKSNTSL